MPWRLGQVPSSCGWKGTGFRKAGITDGTTGIGRARRTPGRIGSSRTITAVATSRATGKAAAAGMIDGKSDGKSGAKTGATTTAASRPQFLLGPDKHLSATAVDAIDDKAGAVALHIVQRQIAIIEIEVQAVPS